MTDSIGTPHFSMTDAIDSLKQLIGKEKVKQDAESLQTFGRDWTRVHEPAPSAILFPRTIDDVQTIVGQAKQFKVAIVPSGGRTGLSGGAVAVNGEWVLAFDYMNQIKGFDPIDRTVTCQPGVITEQLQQYAKEQGLFYPVDFASSGSSQIGGNISTNAGGIKVIRYGMTRDWVAGLTVITGDGELLNLNRGLVKNATGYDLRQLFIGGEGTLGLVVEAQMRLARPPKDLTVLVLGMPEFASIMKLLTAFQSEIDLTAFEFFSEAALEKVTTVQDLARPFETKAAFYALLEFEMLTDAVGDKAMELFEYCVGKGWVLDGVMSQSEAQAKNLWRLREDISETISHDTPYKNDVSVTVSKVPDFLQEVDAVVEKHYPDFEIIWFGHIGDGNLHLNILKPKTLGKTDFFAQCKQVSQWVFEIVQKYEGSISAEHGVGLLKKDFLAYSRSKEEIEIMRGLKKVFDPLGIMNPGKLIDS